MTEKLKQKIQEGMINLPKELQEAINVLDWGKVSEEIGKKHLLNESEINDLQVETGLVLLSLVRGDEYASNIEDNIGTSKEEAEKIAEEVDKTIFGPIYDSFAEKMEKNLKEKSPGWKQTLNFILSGGDYSAFLKKDEPRNTSEETPKINILGNNSRIENIKNKFVI